MDEPVVHETDHPRGQGLGERAEGLGIAASDRGIGELTFDQRRREQLLEGTAGQGPLWAMGHEVGAWGRV